jgi:hypothetical protein
MVKEFTPTQYKRFAKRLSAITAMPQDVAESLQRFTHTE